MIIWFSSSGFFLFYFEGYFFFFCSLSTVRLYFAFSSSLCLIPGDVSFLSELLVLNNWKDCVRKGKRDEGCESCKSNSGEECSACRAVVLVVFLLIYKRTVVSMKCIKMDFVKSVIQIWGSRLWWKSPPCYHDSWKSCETWKLGTVFLLNSLKRGKSKHSFRRNIAKYLCFSAFVKSFSKT